MFNTNIGYHHFLLGVVIFLFHFQLSAQQSLEYAVVFGGSEADGAFDAALSGDNKVIVGSSSSEGLATLGAHSEVLDGDRDGYVALFDSNAQLQWFTYVGGSGLEAIRGVEVIGDWIYFIGDTNSDDLPIIGEHGAGYGGNLDLMIGKMSLAGELIWLRYLGGNDEDIASSAIVPYGDGIAICARTLSDNVPTSTNALQPTHAGENDLLIGSFSSDGEQQYMTYWGGAGDEFVSEMNVNSDGDLFLSGTSRSAELESINSITSKAGELNDAVFMALDPDNFEISFLHFIGGVYSDTGAQMILYNDEIYIYGTSGTPGLATEGVHQIENIQIDIYVAKIAMNGEIEWFTYFGGLGPSQDRASEFVINETGIYFSGTTHASDLSVGDVFQETHGDTSPEFVNAPDVIFGKFNFSGQLIWASYLGGNELDSDQGGLFVSDSSLEIIGTTSSPDFPILNSPQAQLNGSSDVFFTKIDFSTHIDQYFTSLEIDVYPNPTKNHLHINSDKYHVAELVLFDGFGRKVATWSHHRLFGQTMVKLPDLSNGLYHLSVSTEDQKVSKTILIQK